MAARRKREEEAEFLKLNTTSNPTELDILTFALHLLDPSCPAQTTAAALLERHGKLSDVFDTPAQILAECPGVGPRLASALAAYPDLFRAYMESKNQARTRIVDTKTAFAAVQNKFFGRKTEIVVLLILDSKGYLKYMGIVNEGSVHGVPIYIRQIARLCLLYDADAVYLAHNHPSGNCTPSRQDIQTTKDRARTLRYRRHPLRPLYFHGRGLPLYARDRRPPKAPPRHRHPKTADHHVKAEHHRTSADINGRTH